MNLENEIKNVKTYSESKVDLPHPDGPTMETNSPLFSAKDMSVRAGVSPSRVW